MDGIATKGEERKTTTLGEILYRTKTLVNVQEFARVEKLRFLLNGDSELRFARVIGIVESFAGAVALGGAEVEAVLGAVGQADEARLAIDVGALFEVELVKGAESISDVDFDLGSVNGGAGGIGDGEIGGAGSDAAVDGRNGVRIRGSLREGERGQYESGGEKDKTDQFLHIHTTLRLRLS